MKKIYVLLSAACVAVSASAVEKEMAVAKTQPSGAKMVKETVAPKAASKVMSDLSAAKKVKGTRAVGEYTYFRNADDIMSIGSSENGYVYNMTFGFASSYGDIVFNNYSTGASSMEWTYTNLNDYEGSGQNAEWNFSTSSATDLKIKSGIGEVQPASLTSTFSNGTTSTYVLDNFAEYLCGGGASYWGLTDELDGDFGVTFYQNSGLKSPQGYSGGLTYVTSYSPNAEGYDANGVYSDPDGRPWKSRLEQRTGAAVTDIVIDNFTFVQPAPVSTYFITRAWVQLNVEASSDTQLISYIYPIDEMGMMEENPIALGYASISKGDESYMPVFYYYPLDEDGNELEGEVFIDSAVAITVEGFNGNNAITSITPASGYYPFSYEQYAAGNYDLCKEPDMYMQFSFKADGEPTTLLAYDNGLYYFDNNMKDKDTLSLLSYGKLTMDATFAYIYEADGVKDVTIPNEGGSATVMLDALYYNIPAGVAEGFYTISAPDWVKVELGEVADYQTPMTVSVEASEVGRYGVVEVAGLGVSYNLGVIQGDGNAVDVVVLDKNAQYFDLQGRPVANPEKGIFIKKTGNKAEKVIF